MKKQTSKNLIKRIFNFISESGSLMFMRRTHQRSLINTFDSIASHAHHTSIIAYVISRMEGLSHDEGLKALAMGVLHDNAESRTSDLDFVSKNYATTDEEKAIKDQLKELPFEKDLMALISEYEVRETLTSKCAKDADALEQLYQEWILTHMGNTMAKRWFEGDYKHRVPFLRTKSAKKLALEMKNAQPHDWWWEDLIEKGINYTHLNSKK